MIGALTVLGRVVEEVWGWRRLDFGPPTHGYKHTLMLSTHVSWGQAGLSARWDTGGDSSQVTLAAGPLDLYVVYGYRQPRPETDDAGWTRELQVGDQRINVYVVPQHVGWLFKWHRGMWGLLVGPVGVAGEPFAWGKEGS